MTIIIACTITIALVLMTFSLLSIISIFDNIDGMTQNSLKEKTKNKQYFSYIQFFPVNYSESSIQDKVNIVQLLSNYIEQRIHNAQSTLMISAQDKSVRDNLSAGLISEKFMGIPENADISKRQIAKTILELDDDFGSVYFTTPNGNVYLGEPFSQQMQLQKLNYAEREWYKGVTNLINYKKDYNSSETAAAAGTVKIPSKNIYTSGIFISASIHTPAIAIATPVYKDDGNDDSFDINNDNKDLIGYWVGILNLNDIVKSVKGLMLKDNERVVIFDHNGTIVADSKHDYYENSTELRYFDLDKIGTVLMGEKRVIIENNTNHYSPSLSIYYPAYTGSHYWGIVYIIS